MKVVDERERERQGGGIEQFSRDNQLYLCALASVCMEGFDSSMTCFNTAYGLTWTCVENMYLRVGAKRKASLT